MKAALLAAALAALVLGLATLGVRHPRATPLPPGAAKSGALSKSGLARAPCPRGTLPDDGVCIPVPRAPVEGR